MNELLYVMVKTARKYTFTLSNGNTLLGVVKKVYACDEAFPVISIDPGPHSYVTHVSVAHIVYMVPA